ncbi:hypothetical protein HRR83_001062 [Exophiala dermatitidis]|uniref:Alpha/beta hydrolase fold-3 domain-containing protein n=2 Tax=Exophiala dermatitidis TaxID=5970 RepID=H6C7G7_EXODN|nr:uncharacterized protein HMPREF1120_07649 [Exophiala dermatitidis NIH/UT8656]KAJ4522577.1 hypothetical protein HRR75_000971 [Exophiala dermatitidis]EHY59664.1 hypothetical protein HMPREF1120_07649 [Exophiala dermatitidis NIH/UT8656]KAJ4525873.1 hypothetical protein HRR74_001066 [Exophiala dermatitidis]KAJ4527180.1 hypothetical protein HRR73_001977 [Exophiala dermatitidis]KAJ4532903.1 hypothetical protein HRR76_007878 [Exophiala dermatitidis]
MNGKQKSNPKMKSMSDLMVQSDRDWRRQRAADSQTQRQYQFDYQNRTHCLVPSQSQLQHFRSQTVTTGTQPTEQKPVVVTKSTVATSTAPATTTPSASTTTTTAAKSSSSSIQITTRTDLSLLYRLLRLAIRPLRPRLVSPPKTPFPPGSIRLFEENDHGMKRKWGCNVVESRREGVWEYTFCPDFDESQSRSRPQSQSKTIWNENQDEKRDHRCPLEKSYRRHQVYYFAGGGFQAPPSGEHWLFLAQLAKECGEHSEIEIGITLVSYPLAPSSPAADSLPMMRTWLTSVLDEARLSGDTVSLAGDSSGGNIALSLGFWAVEHYKEDETNLKSSGAVDKGTAFPLRSVLCISPPVDMRNTNPAISECDKVDPVLTMGLTERIAREWTAADSSRENTAKKISYSSESSSSASSRDVEPAPCVPFSSEDPSTSPLLNPESAFRALKERGVSVHGVIGTHDVLAPDALEFLRRCESQGINGRWLVWEGQMHCFPLAGGYQKLGLREGRVGRQFVLDLLRNDARIERS